MYVGHTFLLLLIFFIFVCLHFLFGGENKKKSLNNMKTKMTWVTHISEANLLFRAWRIGDGDIKCCMEGREIRDAQFLLLKQRTMWVLDTGTVSNPTTHTATTTMTCVYSSLYRSVILLLYISQHCWALDSDWSAALTVAQVYINTLVLMHYCFYSNSSFTRTCILYNSWSIHTD